MDFSAIVALIRGSGVGGEKVTNVLKKYDENKTLIDYALAQVWKHLVHSHPTVITTPLVIPPPPAPLVQPAPVIAPTPVTVLPVTVLPDFHTGHYPQILSRIAINGPLGANKPYWLEDDRRGGSGGPAIERALFEMALVGNGYAQMQNQRMHVNVDGYDVNGAKFGGGNPVVRSLVRENGKSPCLDFQWWVDGKLASSGEYGEREIDDPLEIQSYEDADVGFTPCFFLGEPAVGKREVKLVAKMPARYNGGVELVSEPCIWFID